MASLASEAPPEPNRSNSAVAATSDFASPRERRPVGVAGQAAAQRFGLHAGRRRLSEKFFAAQVQRMPGMPFGHGGEHLVPALGLLDHGRGNDGNGEP